MHYDERVKLAVTSSRPNWMCLNIKSPERILSSKLRKRFASVRVLYMSGRKSGKNRNLKFEAQRVHPGVLFRGGGGVGQENQL